MKMALLRPSEAVGIPCSTVLSSASLPYLFITRMRSYCGIYAPSIPFSGCLCGERARYSEGLRFSFLALG